MTSNPVTELLTFLGIGGSRSPPHVSNDNPNSESQFKTLKYGPAFPQRFGCVEDARSFCETFFALLNRDRYRHSGIANHTPASVHFGTAEEVRLLRAGTFADAYAANPARFRHRQPGEIPPLPTPTAGAAARGVDQRAEGGTRRDRAIGTCLKLLAGSASSTAGL